MQKRLSQLSKDDFLYLTFVKEKKAKKNLLRQFDRTKKILSFDLKNFVIFRSTEEDNQNFNSTISIVSSTLSVYPPNFYKVCSSD